MADRETSFVPIHFYVKWWESTSRQQEGGETNV